jgi:cephalosporin hydroxylase
MNPADEFRASVRANIERMSEDPDLHALSRLWSRYTGDYKYTYNFSWLGVPIIQLPPDMVAMQELIWQVKPDLVIETGIAHGGSLIMSASLLMLVDYCEAVSAGGNWNPSTRGRRVVGVDIDIRSHNRSAIEQHPMASRITLIQGSSTAPDIVASVRAQAKGARSVLVCLDSDHTHDHVLAELEAYAPMVSAGSYCVVFDTLIEDRPHGFFPDRRWDKGNNPKTAVWEYVKHHPEFVIDKDIPNKLLITTAPDGYLKRIR